MKITSIVVLLIILITATTQAQVVKKSDTEWLKNVEILKENVMDRYYVIGVGTNRKSCEIIEKGMNAYSMHFEDHCGNTYKIPYHDIGSVSNINGDEVVYLKVARETISGGFTKTRNGSTTNIKYVTIKVKNAKVRQNIRDAFYQLAVLAYRKMN